MPLTKISAIGRWLVAAIVISNMNVAHAQTTPKIEYLFPPGAQRGTDVEVQFGGEYMPDGSRLSSSGEGLVLQSGASSTRYRFAIAAAAAPGPREVRLSCVQGASSPFPFVIGELPEVIHANAREPLELLKFPVTANGRLDAAGDLDEYVVTLAAETQIVCAATTRAIRSPVDPVMRLLDPDGKPVAVSTQHRSADALLVFRAAKPGRYRLQVYDFQLLGSVEHVYRMTVTTGPWLDYVFPAGLARDVATNVTLYGWNLPTAPGRTHSLSIAPQPEGRYGLTLPGGFNSLTLPVGVNPEVLEVEPNDDSAQAGALSLPVTVNGRLSKPEEVDVFAFTAKKGEQVALDVDSAELRFPSDMALTISNEAGKLLTEVDDAKGSRDPSLRFAVPADGRYFVSLSDRSRAGGEEFVYRLHVSAAAPVLRPDVTARVNVSSLALPSGQTTNLAVVVNRVDGLADELEVTAINLPAGIEVKPQPVPAKTPATIQLPITVADKTAPIGGLVRVIVRKTNSAEPNDRIAVIAESATATSVSQDLWLAVSPEVPFTVSISGPILDAPRLAAFPFPVSVTRKAGFTGPIRLIGVEPDRRGTLIPLTGEIAANSDLGSIPLVIQHKVIEGTTHRSRVMGVAEVLGADGKPYPVFHVATGAMSVGCFPSWLTMKVEPILLAPLPNESQPIEVQLFRRVKMQPIKLRLVPPPGIDGIECEPVEVGVDQDRAVLQLRVAPKSVLPPRLMLDIKAESSRDGLPIYGATSFRLEAR